MQEDDNGQVLFGVRNGDNLMKRHEIEVKLKKWGIFRTILPICAILLLAACSNGADDDLDRPTGEVFIAAESESLVSTFFEFEIIEAKTVELEGRSAGAGEEFIAVTVRIKNVWDTAIPMAADFDISWESPESGAGQSGTETVAGDGSGSAGGGDSGTSSDGTSANGNEAVENGSAENAAGGDAGRPKNQQLSKTIPSQLPDSYTLEVDEEVTGDLLFEAPAGGRLWLIYEELWDDDFVGNTYEIIFTVQDEAE